MVRENPETEPTESLEATVRKADRFEEPTDEEELQTNSEPIAIRGDAEPEKKG